MKASNGQVLSERKDQEGEKEKKTSTENSTGTHQDEKTTDREYAAWEILCPT